MATITIHRGTHQIGGCVTEICADSHRVVIDFGEALPGSQSGSAASDEELVHKVFDEKPDAVLFTHYHGDHYGMYQRIPAGVPLYIGATAKKILEILTERLDDIPGKETAGLPIIRSMRTYTVGRWMEGFGGIRVMPLVVDHSALDAYMFLIETSGIRMLYTGDFREHGIAGSNNRFERMLREYVGKVDLLITEGTMLSRAGEERENTIRTEADLGKRAGEFFRQNRQTVILVSSTNLDSIMEFLHAVPEDMAFVCDEYQAEVILTAIEEKGKWYSQYRRPLIYGRIPRQIYIVGSRNKLGPEQGCYDADSTILRRKGFVMLARENNNPRMEKNRFEKILETLDDPLILYSKWSGYLDRAHGGYTDKYADAAVNRLIGNHRFVSLHTSGHAYVETLQKLIRLTQPRMIVPMHTECADGFVSLPEFTAYRDRIRVLQDGETFDLEELKS